MSNIISALIGSIEPGIITGLERGLQYDIDWVKLEAKALLSGDTQMQKDVAAVKDKWLSEVSDGAGKVKKSIVKGLLDQHDPFKGSRAMMQALLVKYPL